MADNRNVTAADVIVEELRAIHRRRAHVNGRGGKPWKDAKAQIEDLKETDADSRLTEARLMSLREHTVGLSFSGGGIRSGTFCVGFLQGLAQVGLLRRIDYLSTVSGGGYAGGWLAAWLKRDGDPANVEKQLDPSRVEQAKASRALLPSKEQVVDEEPEPLFHLRQYSSYLFPRPGILGADIWTVIAIWIRNVSINLMLLLPLAMMIVLIARVVVYLYATITPEAINRGETPGWLVWPFLVFGIACLVLGWLWNAQALGEFRQSPLEEGVYRTGRPWKRMAHIERDAQLLFRLPLILAAVFLLIPIRAAIWWIGSQVESATAGGTGFAGYASRNLGILDPINVGGHALVIGVVMMLGALAGNLRNGTLVWRDANRRLVVRWRFLSAALIAGATGGVLLTLVEWVIRSLNDASRPDLIATVVPPLGLLVMVAAVQVEVALLGRVITEAEREWWARVNALLMLSAILWMLTMGVIIYVPGLYVSAGPWIRLALTSGWVGGTAAAVLSGRLAGPTPSAGRGRASQTLAMIAQMGPPVFLVGLLGLVSLLVSFLVNTPTPTFATQGDGWVVFREYLGDVGRAPLQTIFDWMIVVFVLFLIAWRLIDANLFSLHAMYANRLIRCYLAASRPKQHWARRWGGPHDPTARGGASSLSELKGDPQAGGATATTGPGPGARSIKDLEKPLDALEKERDDHLKRLRGTGYQPLPIGSNGPDTVLDPRWRATLAKLQKALSGLVDGLEVRRNAPDLKAGEREQIEEALNRRRGELLGYKIGQRSRDENPVTGFDPQDDIPLYRLRIGEGNGVDRAYWGPYPLFNTELNLVAGEELAMRDRKGEAFVLSPLYCGSKSVGYAPVTIDSCENLTLGRAITISGAAVDPNMSVYQTSALTALLTIFNARLGYWMENPRLPVKDLDNPSKAPSWTAKSPRAAGRLISELLGRTNNDTPYIHLSDGGHFENLGVYELIRRRCRYIIAVDTGEDSDASDENLANLVRLCRIDFGIRVELDTRALQAEGPDRLTRTHVVIGRVHYEDVDTGQVPGILVYVKISMTGDEPSDLQKYASKDPRFPHHPTDLRQSFDEEQFECYRVLGVHIAREVFADAVREVQQGEGERIASNGVAARWPEARDHREYVNGNQRLFGQLRNRWASPPADEEVRYAELSRAWAQLQRDVRKEPRLAALSRDLYPELVAPGTAAPPASLNTPAVMHAVGQMLQIMEDAWVSLGMKGRYDLPTDRGWMNVFRRWTSTRAFRHFWPALRAEFSPAFVKFCETQLHLGIHPEPLRIPPDYAADKDPFVRESIARLGEELRREWPGTDLLEKLDCTLNAPAGPWKTQPPAWLVVQSPPRDGTPAPTGDERFACGVVLLWEDTNGTGATPPDRPPAAPRRFELFAWVRRPSRSTGLGTRCIDHILEVLYKEMIGMYPEDHVEVRIRYPKPSNPINPDLELEMWKGFFALYNFQPERLDDGEVANRNETVLVYRHKPEPRNGPTSGATRLGAGAGGEAVASR
jgi:hypothetical protein